MVKITKKGKTTTYHWTIPEKEVTSMMKDVERIVKKNRKNMGYRTEYNVALYALALRNAKPKTGDRAVIKFVKKKKLKKVM